jgi:hypothetical protein
MIKLRIDYGSELIILADAGRIEELRALYDLIPEDDLSPRDWLKIFQSAAEKSNIAINHIGVVAASQAKEFQVSNWQTIFAYAKLREESEQEEAVTGISNIVPEQMKFRVNMRNVDILKSKILEDRHIVISAGGFGNWLKNFEVNYSQMEHDQKLLCYNDKAWSDCGIALNKYCKDPEISDEQKMYYIILVNNMILEINVLRKENGQYPEVKIIVRVPRGLYDSIKQGLIDYESFALSSPAIINALIDDDVREAVDLIQALKSESDSSTPHSNRSEVESDTEDVFSKVPNDVVKLIAAKTLLLGLNKSPPS